MEVNLSDSCGLLLLVMHVLGQRNKQDGSQSTGMQQESPEASPPPATLPHSIRATYRGGGLEVSFIYAIYKCGSST